MHLVQVLGLSSRGDTLSHWMAHYLAELFAAEEVATGEEKERLGDKITEITMRLWREREHLPREADPTRLYARAGDVLAALRLGVQSRSEWEQFSPRKPLPAALGFVELSSQLAVLEVSSMMSEDAEETSGWLSRLTDAKEAEFMAALAEVYAGVIQGGATKGTSALRDQLREARGKLLEKMQAVLDEMRAAL